MAFNRPKARTLSPKVQQSLISQSATQTGKKVKPSKTYDADFPVFDVPVNQKVLIYVPNVMNEDGSFAMDNYIAHDYKAGKTYGVCRCISGLQLDETDVPEEDRLNYDGICPICEVTQKCWSLYNLKYAGILETKGLTKDSPEAQDACKQDRKNLVEEMAIAPQTTRWLTFPIVVIDCKEKDGKMTTIPDTPEGEITGKKMWYTVRENTYQNKWFSQLEELTEDGEEVSPAGKWLILDFTYNIDDPSKATKMDSARNLTISSKSPGKYADVFDAAAAKFDNECKEWTIEKAQETIVNSAVRSKEETAEIATAIEKEVDKEISALSGGAIGIGAAPASARAAVPTLAPTPSNH